MAKILRNKKGAASFYIVAFSTLVMVIVAASFAAFAVSEIARTSNDDLSQSAYDSAMAGIEDAKLAYANYLTCLQKGARAVKPDGMAPLTCDEIVWLVQNPNDGLSGCDMVAKIVGRIPEYGSGEVVISELSSANNNMNQAYTCTKIDTVLSDYRATLNSVNTYKVIKVQLEDTSNINNIAWVRFSWYAKSEGKVLNYTNIVGSSVAFQPLTAVKVSTPPTVSFSLIQTARSFAMADLNGQTNASGETDRATVYLVPSDSKSVAGASNTTYTGAYSSTGGNAVSASAFAATNNVEKNLPYVVYCPDSDSTEYAEDDFVCSVKIGLPKPIGYNGGSGGRNTDTFMFVVALPYGQPDTEFGLELCTEEGSCLARASSASTGSGIVEVQNMQVAIDSTGRANDLFRRVELRMESTGSGFSYPLYVIEALNPTSGVSTDAAKIEKLIDVTSEQQR